MATTQKPLLLKDFLKLDPYSDSSLSLSSTMRHLLASELGHPTTTTTFTLLSKLSSFIHSLKLLPCPSISSSASLSRTFSKRLKRSFWKKRPRQDEFPNTIKVKDIMSLRSFNNVAADNNNSPSPVLSSCSSNSSLWSSASGPEFTDGNSEKNSPARAVGGSAATDRRRQETKDPEKRRVENDDTFHSEEEKEQLSPVSVMDFPYQDEDDDEDELRHEESFHQSLATIERTKHQLLKKIRQFECLADLDPVDLNPVFEDNSHVPIDADEEEGDDDVMVTRTRELFKLVQPNPFGSTLDKSSEKLLVHFFSEQLSCVDHEDIKTRSSIPRQEQEEVLVNDAKDWMKGACRKWDEEERGEAYLEDMERDGRWRCFQGEEREMVVALEVALLNSLLDEMVMDLLS